MHIFVQLNPLNLRLYLALLYFFRLFLVVVILFSLGTTLRRRLHFFTCSISNSCHSGHLLLLLLLVVGRWFGGGLPLLLALYLHSTLQLSWQVGSILGVKGEKKNVVKTKRIRLKEVGKYWRLNPMPQSIRIISNDDITFTLFGILRDELA